MRLEFSETSTNNYKIETARKIKIIRFIKFKLNKIILSTEEVENFRDVKWRREETLKIKTAREVEAFVEDLGFCLALTDSRTNLPQTAI